MRKIRINRWSENLKLVLSSNFKFLYNFRNFQVCPILTILSRAVDWNFQYYFYIFLTILLLLFKVYEDECREFEKRHCQMEQRPQKKQIKKYVYNIRCEPRTLRPCHTFNVAKMSTHCEPEFYDKCQVVPHEKCQEVPKEACFKEPVMVKRTKCSSGPTSSDFSTTTSKLSENSFTADQY